MQISKQKIKLIMGCALQLFVNSELWAEFELEDFDPKQHQTHYNSLPSVEESAANLKHAPQFQTVLKEAEELIRRYELEKDIGLRLIHRHFLLDKNQVMAEKYENIHQIPSLVTEARTFEDALELSALPSSWIFSDQSEQKIYLFETSSDPAVKNVRKQLEESPEFFEEMGKILIEHQMNDLLSAAVLRRANLVPEANQIFMEINSEEHNKSIVQVWDTETNPVESIRTSWSFKGPKQQKCYPRMGCVWVPDYPKGKHRYLVIGHVEFPDDPLTNDIL